MTTPTTAAAAHEADGDEPLSSVTLELADTRPVMVWLPWLGALPIQAAGLLITVFGVLMSIMGSWIWFMPLAPVWWAGARLVALDYHAFTRIDRWLATSAFSWDAGTEGGASATPGPTRPRRGAAAAFRRPRHRGIA
jgi:type IV secretory pathway VirB3-like protein